MELDINEKQELLRTSMKSKTLYNTEVMSSAGVSACAPTDTQMSGVTISTGLTLYVITADWVFLRNALLSHLARIGPGR